MVNRILTLVIVISLLVFVLLYSQHRTQTLKVSGYIEADEIRLGSRVGGRVAEVLTDEGKHVEQGDVLVRLEPFDLRELEQEAIATLAEKQAEVDRLEEGFRDEEIAQSEARLQQLAAREQLLRNGPRQQEIDAARERVVAAQAEDSLAEQNYERAKSLLDRGATTRQEFDAAQERLKSARAMTQVRIRELEVLELGSRQEEIKEAEASLAEARAALKLMQNGYRTEEIAKARAARDAAEAALAAIRVRLEELTIRSPVDGVVEAMELQPGDLVSGGAPVMSVIDNKRLWVRAYLPENRLNVELGQKLWVTVDSFPDRKFEGELTFVSRQAEFTPSNVQTPEERSKQVFRIKVTLSEVDVLRPGMAADVWLDSSP